MDMTIAFHSSTTFSVLFSWVSFKKAYITIFRTITTFLVCQKLQANQKSKAVSIGSLNCLLSYIGRLNWPVKVTQFYWFVFQHIGNWQDNIILMSISESTINILISIECFILILWEGFFMSKMFPTLLFWIYVRLHTLNHTLLPSFS